ncbi:EAL domain-containing protein [bacterium CPR1]|nr:EAL domain-containing protein [bacterium CPR1]
MRERERVLRRLDQGLARARRRTRDMALLLVSMNGELTHDLERELEGQLRREDDLLPLGPDRFAAVAEDLRHVSDVLRISRRLRQKSDQHGLELRIGITHSATFYSDALAMLEAAESTLASLGSDELERLANPQLHAEAAGRIELEAELGLAMERNQLQVYYQPIVELSQGRVCGFEALVRWPHPSRGILLPAEFLKVADESGLMTRLDLMVMRQALARLRIWSDTRPVRLSVNLCPEHFTDPERTDALMTVLQESGAPLGHVRLDVREEAVTDQTRQSSLKRLHDVDIGFHLDNFGMGTSSFLCLRSFPFECLKVDRSLIFEMESEESCELIASVLKVAATMKMRTIAEGVTTHAQLEELRALGCREAQGYLFAPPLDEEGATRILAEDPRW